MVVQLQLLHLNIATKIINYLGISPSQESSSVASYSNFEGKSVINEFMKTVKSKDNSIQSVLKII